MNIFNVFTVPNRPFWVKIVTFWSKFYNFRWKNLEFQHWVIPFIIWFWVFGLLEVRSILDLYFDKKWTFFTKILKFKIRTSIIRTSWNRKRHKNGSVERSKKCQVLVKTTKLMNFSEFSFLSYCLRKFRCENICL